MAQLIVVWWRDIPAQVICKAGRQTAKRELPQRFQEAIDMAAMRAGLHGTDAYLQEWRRDVAGECGPELETEVAAAAARLEGEYDEARLKKLVLAGGKAEG